MSVNFSQSDISVLKQPHNRWVSLIIGLPLLVWLASLLTFSVNIPWFDDLDPFSDFIRQWTANPDFSDRLALLFRPNNEHRMIFGKLSALFYFLITGELNFTFLHIAGALFYIGAFAICFQIFRLLQLPLLYFAPVSFLFFHLKTHLVFLWAVCSLQHQPVVFFVCLTVWLLAKRKFLGALIAGICTTFAMSNGMLVWAAGGVVLLYRSNWKQLALWSLVGLAAIMTYFSGMTTQNNESSFTFLMQHPHLPPLGFLTFLGGLLDIFPINQPIVLRSTLPVLGGGLLTGWALWYVFKRLRIVEVILLRKKSYQSGDVREDKEHTVRDFVLGLLVFSLVNGLIIGVLRPRFGFFVFLLSNYKLYTFLFAITAYLGILSTLKTENRRRIVGMIFGGAAIMIWVFSLITEISVINERRKFLLLSAYNQEHNGFGLGFAPDTPAAAFLDTLMQDLTTAGIYTYPSVYEPYYKAIKTLKEEAELPPTLRYERQSENVLIAQENTQLGLMNRKELAIAYALKGGKLYVFPMSQANYQGKNPFRQYERTKYASIPYAYLEPGEYDLGVLEVSKQSMKNYKIDKLFIERLAE